MLYIFILFFALFFLDFKDIVVLSMVLFFTLSLLLYAGVPYWALGI